MFSPQWHTKTPTRAIRSPSARDQPRPRGRLALTGAHDGLEDRLGLVDAAAGVRHGEHGAAVHGAALDLAHHLPEVDLRDDEAADLAGELPDPLAGGRPGGLEAQEPRPDPPGLREGDGLDGDPRREPVGGEDAPGAPAP